MNRANLDDMAKFLKDTIYDNWLKNSLDLSHFSFLKNAFEIKSHHHQQQKQKPKLIQLN